MDDHLGYNNHDDQKGQVHTCPWFHFKFHFVLKVYESYSSNLK